MQWSYIEYVSTSHLVFRMDAEGREIKYAEQYLNFLISRLFQLPTFTHALLGAKFSDLEYRNVDIHQEFF